MKSVLISIQPKWCELIANGSKTIEVRKSRPQLGTPFKCYIYETKGLCDTPTFIDESGYMSFRGRGQVIGEFTCDKIKKITPCGLRLNGLDYNIDLYDLLRSRLSDEELNNYGKDKLLYSWHISELKIYDKPKELSEFNSICPYRKPDGTRMKVDCPCDKYTWDWDEERGKAFCTRRITRPPQSWCYVEESEE